MKQVMIVENAQELVKLVQDSESSLYLEWSSDEIILRGQGYEGYQLHPSITFKEIVDALASAAHVFLKTPRQY